MMIFLLGFMGPCAAELKHYNIKPLSPRIRSIQLKLKSSYEMKELQPSLQCFPP